MHVERFAENPIIRPHMDARMGDNINGPSLIKVPDWIAAPLGRYYLYFAHHDGRYIRLAYADTLTGPWTIYEPGTLLLAQSRFAGHIASPDVHVDDANRRIVLYYHGADEVSGVPSSRQQTRVAHSTDGLHFRPLGAPIGHPYARAFTWQGFVYLLTMPGVFYRSRDGSSDFEQGPTLFTPNMRHSAVMLDGDKLQVFYTDVGDAPESILLSTLELSEDWHDWRASPPVTVLTPETDYEGGNLARAPSVRGLVRQRVCQLRDPAIYREAGRTYLLYAVAGESGIAIAELINGSAPPQIG